MRCCLWGESDRKQTDDIDGYYGREQAFCWHTLYYLCGNSPNKCFMCHISPENSLCRFTNFILVRTWWRSMMCCFVTQQASSGTFTALQVKVPQVKNNLTLKNIHASTVISLLRNYNLFTVKNGISNVQDPKLSRHHLVWPLGQWGDLSRRFNLSLIVVFKGGQTRHHLLSHCANQWTLHTTQCFSEIVSYKDTISGWHQALHNWTSQHHWVVLPTLSI